MCQIIDYDYEVIDVVSIRDGKILLVKKRDFWIFPGGKREEGESDRECIVRELSQELTGSRLVGGIDFFCQFYGLNPSGKKIKVISYFGNVEGDISPGAEILDARWISGDEIFLYFLSEITKKIIQKLLNEKFI